MKTVILSLLFLISHGAFGDDQLMTDYRNLWAKYRSQAISLRVTFLHGYYVDAEGINIQVFSTGCTDKANFKFVKTKVDDGLEITIMTEKIDSCETGGKKFGSNTPMPNWRYP